MKTSTLLLPFPGHAVEYFLQVLVVLVMSVGRWSLEATPITRIAYTTDMTDSLQIRDLAMIIDSLENLGVLETDPERCYSLDQIVKSTVSLKHTISLDLHVTSVDKAQWMAASRDHDINSRALLQGDTSGPFLSGCFRAVSRDPYHLVHAQTPTDSPALTNYTQLNGTGAGPPPSNGSDPANQDPRAEKHEEGGLSLAQIMTITSCSIVIGLFFMAAMGMRLRNYVKRKRLKQTKRRTNRSSGSTQGSHENDPDGHNQHQYTMSYPRPKPPRSHGYKLGSSGGFSLFYTHGDGGGGGGGGWSHGFAY